MKLATTTGIMSTSPGKPCKFSMLACLEAVKAAGFDKVDINLWSLSRRDGMMAQDDWEDSIAEIAEKARQLDLPVCQTHGNTRSGLYWDDPDFPDHEFIDWINMRCLKATKILGAKWMVMHPYNLPHEKLYSRERGLAVNLEKFAPFIEEAKRQGVSIAIENMLDFGHRRRRYCGGDVLELIELVDTINDPDVGICLDTGHANNSGIDVAEGIRAIGSRLKCLHVNDNNGEKDEHLAPYLGTVKWPEVLRALREIGYAGDFTYEIGCKNIPPELQQDWLVYAAAIGKKMLAMEFK